MRWEYVLKNYNKDCKLELAKQLPGLASSKAWKILLVRTKKQKGVDVVQWGVYKLDEN